MQASDIIITKASQQTDDKIMSVFSSPAYLTFKKVTTLFKCIALV